MHVDGSDYTSVGPGILRFDVNGTSVSIPVPILDDSLGEPVEELTLHLETTEEDSGKVTFSQPTTTVRILDNDESNIERELLKSFLHS